MSSLFSNSNEYQQEISKQADKQFAAYEKLLSMRITLQKVLDEGNKLPCGEFHTSMTNEKEYKQCDKNIKSNLRTMKTYLDCEVNKQKRCRSEMSDNDNDNDDDDDDIEWEDLMASQKELQNSWESITNKWYSRLHYGSERTQSKMKVFNQTIWEQIGSILNDDDKVQEKSMSSLGQSLRIDKPNSSLPSDQIPNSNNDSDSDIDSGSDSDNDNNDKNKSKNKSKSNQYDEEVYDDRGFYSLLLKAFITSGSQGSGLRADDIAQLRKYRKNSKDVDRRASKGRKTRYTVHKKLQNFMFPHELPDSSLDVDRLLQSLFQ